MLRMIENIIVNFLLQGKKCASCSVYVHSVCFRRFVENANSDKCMACKGTFVAQQSEGNATQSNIIFILSCIDCLQSCKKNLFESKAKQFLYCLIFHKSF